MTHPIDLLKSAIPQEIQGFLAKLNNHGDFYLVGGCVRDALMGRTPKDFDIVTTTPGAAEEMGFPQIGESFPVWQTRCGEHVIEIAAARTEIKTGTGHDGFEVTLTDSIHQDLQRRDLTINTFAWDGREDLVHAPQALEDLESKTLRHVGPAFSEDPLRVYRVARFAAQLGYTVAPETIGLIQGFDREELKSVTRDRVREEMLKALRSPFPEMFFRVLQQGEALVPWFNEVHHLQGSLHSPKHHPEGFRVRKITYLD